MKKLILILSFFLTTVSYSQISFGGGGSSITTNSDSFIIYINGQEVGQGSVTGIKIPKNECITVQVSPEITVNPFSKSIFTSFKRA